MECFCVFDTDSDKGAKDAANLLAKRLDIAAALGREGDPADLAIILGEPLFVVEGYATLDPNFEGAMGALFGEEWARFTTMPSPRSASPSPCVFDIRPSDSTRRIRRDRRRRD